MASASDTRDFPERVGRYELLVPIASGGMATVYLARQTGAGGFERQVALKLMHPHLRSEDEWTTELLEEGRLAARIRHPNVVQVLDVDDAPQGVHLVMEYVEGDSLAGLLARGLRAARTMGETAASLPVPVSLAILRDALLGLHAAHELVDDTGAPLDVVHRDFSPQNILVGRDGVSRLTDFGVAKAASRLSLTGGGLIKGKIGYMSPEQVRGQPLDRRSDVWSAGVCAWEALAGQRLFRGDADANVLFRIVEGEVRSLRELRPELPAALESAIAGALTVPRDERCSTARELWQRIERAWAPYGHVADRDEVAALVERLVGDTLAERRERVSRILLERTAPPSSPSSHSSHSSGAASAGGRGPLVSVTDVGTVPTVPYPARSAAAVRPIDAPIPAHAARRMWPMTFAVAGAVAVLGLTALVARPRPAPKDLRLAVDPRAIEPAALTGEPTAPALPPPGPSGSTLAAPALAAPAPAPKAEIKPSAGASAPIATARTPIPRAKPTQPLPRSSNGPKPGILKWDGTPRAP